MCRVDNMIYIRNGCQLITDRECTNVMDGDIITEVPRLNGGIDIGIDMILDPVMSILDVVFEPIQGPLHSISFVFIFAIKLVIWFIKLVIWGVFLLIFLIRVLIGLPMDCVQSVMAIATALILAIPQLVMAIIKWTTNTFGGFIMGGFWGWDKIPSNSQDYHASNYWKSSTNLKGKCYSTAHPGSVPFSVLLATIFMPPLGVFMTVGLTGWFQILLATVLTIIFYFPGLIYALLIVYS
jgi:uncharacterized membrane protein YqaE (UPF0057 family)